MPENKEKDVLSELYRVVLSRKKANPEESYAAKLFHRGRKKICQKLGEEAVETVIAALAEGKKETISESADMLFHLTVLWAEMGIKPAEVMAELDRRMGISGLDEKAARGKMAKSAKAKSPKGKKPKRI